MREAKLLSTGKIPINEIDCSNRLRPVSETAVESLVASIQQLGRIKDEVHVRRVAHQGGRLRLIAGGHRVEAARRLDWADIPAKVWDCSDDWATFLEIDDNLAHAELSPLELATFLAARKRVYEKLYPSTKQGVAGGKARQGSATDIMSFAKSVAEKRNMSERHIQRMVSAGEALDERAVELLRRAPRPVTQNDLMTLAKINDDNLRDTVIKGLAAGEFKRASDGVKAAKPKPIPADDPVDKAHKKLLADWLASPKAAKRRFVASIAKDLKALGYVAFDEDGY